MNIPIKNIILAITVASSTASATEWDIGLDKKNFSNTVMVTIMYAGSARACEETMLEGDLTHLYEGLQSYGKKKGFANDMTNSFQYAGTETLIQKGAKAQKEHGKISCSEVAFNGVQLYKSLSPLILNQSTDIPDAISKVDIDSNELLKTCDGFVSENNKRMPIVANKFMTIENQSCVPLDGKVFINYRILINMDDLKLENLNRKKVLNSLCTTPDYIGLMEYFDISYTLINSSSGAYIDKWGFSKSDCI